MITILFLFIYGLTTAGTTVSMHYCMDKYVGWSLYKTQNKKCEKCGMKKAGSGGCCKDECKYIQVKKEHPLSVNSIAPPKFDPCVSVISHSIYLFDYIRQTKKSSTIIHAPPLISGLSKHILNCTFLI